MDWFKDLHHERVVYMYTFLYLWMSQMVGKATLGTKFCDITDIQI